MMSEFYEFFNNETLFVTYTDRDLVKNQYKNKRVNLIYKGFYYILASILEMFLYMKKSL